MTPVTITHYVMLDGQQQGPFSIGQLQGMWNAGRVNQNTLHYMDGYSEWLPLDFIREDLEPRQSLSAYQAAPGYLAPQTPQVLVVAKSRGIYIILGLFFFGLFGAHNFYAGRYQPAVIQLAITILTGWLVIPAFCVAIWVIYECVTIKTDGNGIRMS